MCLGIWCEVKARLASELKSDLLDSTDWGKKQLVNFDDGKYNLYSFERPNNSGAIDLKMDGSVFKENIESLFLL